VLKTSRLIVAAIMCVEALCSVQGPIKYDERLPSNNETNFTFIDDMLLKSSRYTQKDEDDSDVIDEYHSRYTLSYTEPELLSMGFNRMIDTDVIDVYFERDSFSVIVIDQASGYQWSSRPEFQGFSGTREDNTAARNLMNSGIWVDYVKRDKVSSSTITTASIYSMAEVKYANNAAYDEDNPDQTRPYMLEVGTYDTNKVSVSVINAEESSFTARVDLKMIGASFDVVMAVVDGQLESYVDVATVAETDTIYQLIAVTLFPYLGAARENKMPGYIVIPDGVGAMVRTNRYYDTYFQANFYGSDRGYDRRTITELNLPIYGMVHEPGTAGYLANIIEGSESATLMAYLWGKSSRYHRVSTRFNLRQIYKKIIDKAGNGYEVIDEALPNTDFRVRYQFLNGEDASYVGIGKGYRDYLIDTNVLTEREKGHDNKIPLGLDYILSEQEPAFIGTKTVTMTTPDDMAEYYNYFKDEGLTNQQMTLLGWSKDGFVNRAPYRFQIQYKNDLENFITDVRDDGNDIYIDNNYFVSTNLSKRVSYRDDVARDLSRLKMALPVQDDNSKVREVYFINPEVSLDKAQNDIEDYESLGVSGVALGSMGDTLFSYYDGGIRSRTDAIATYREVAALYDGLALGQPFSYLWDHLDNYTDLPITNTQFDYYTDLIPLIPIILKGSLSYYTPYLNFNALGIDRLLTMVDFGTNPSYVLTKQPSSDLRYTEARGFYTTTFADFDEEIIEVYDYLNAALSSVIGAYIESRTMVETGFSKVTYSNDIVIYVNYSSSQKADGAITVPAQSYRVVAPL